jgi:Protein of unknown function (DUF1203)
MTTTPVATRIRVHAIDAATLRQLRQRDDAGHPPRLQTPADGGEPLRCCLRRSQPGEQLALVSYAPLRRWAQRTGADPGPYEEVGPVFIHPEPCEGPAGSGIPSDFLGRHFVLRAYLADGRILGGTLIEAPDEAGPVAAEAQLLRLLADPDVAAVHVRAVEFGCFQFEVSRG